MLNKRRIKNIPLESGIFKDSWIFKIKISSSWTFFFSSWKYLLFQKKEIHSSFLRFLKIIKSKKNEWNEKSNEVMIESIPPILDSSSFFFLSSSSSFPLSAFFLIYLFYLFFHSIILKVLKERKKERLPCQE